MHIAMEHLPLNVHNNIYAYVEQLHILEQQEHFSNVLSDIQTIGISHIEDMPDLREIPTGIIYHGHAGWSRRVTEALAMVSAQK